jgi:plastocyanin
MTKTLFIGLLVIAILMSGCVSTTPTPTTQPTTPATTAQSTNMVNVDIINLMFLPANVTVTTGTTVTWTNRDNIQHTITSVTGAFDSGYIDPGKAYNFTFNQTGSFEYSCSIHPSMTPGTITVT